MATQDIPKFKLYNHDEFRAARKEKLIRRLKRSRRDGKLKKQVDWKIREGLNDGLSKIAS